MKNKKPNFLIVGAAKSGTTSLARHLSLHDEIFIPEQKELRYFIKDSIDRINPKDPLLDGILETSILQKKQYYNLFDVGEKLKGEASVHYLYHYEEVIPKITAELGDIPIIIMLRNPINRAISNYEYLYNWHYNSFEKELLLEEFKRKENFNSFWYYKELGLYSQQVKAYLDNFTNVKIILSEEFFEDFHEKMNEIFHFLEVKPIYIKNYIHNKSKMDSNFMAILKKIGFIRMSKNWVSMNNRSILKGKLDFLLNRTKKNAYPTELINDLFIYYREDIKALEKILNRSLDLWNTNFFKNG